MTELNPRILIFRNDRLGDLVLALPVLDALRKAFPKAHLAMLVSAYGAPLVEKDPRLDQVIVAGPAGLSMKSGTADAGLMPAGQAGLLMKPGTLDEVKRGKFDTALLLWATWSNAWLAFRAGIQRRIGPSARPFSFLLTDRLPIRRSQGRKSEAEYNLDHLKPLGVDAEERKARLFLPREDQAAADEWLQHQGIGPSRQRPLVILHPGTGGSSLRWKAAHYGRLGDLLAKRFGVRLLLSGGPKEQALLREVAGGMKAKALVLGQELPLRVFAALIARARLFVSAATGPMHIAAACGVPTLSFYPPIVPMSPLRWRPFGNRHAVLTPPGLGIGCPRCLGPACPFYDCMERITPEAALDAAEFLIGHKAPVL